VLLLVVGILLAICLLISQWRIGQIASSVREEFREQSLRSIVVYARLTGEWLERDEMASLEGTADLLLAGSGRYVHVQTAAGVVLDRRTPDPAVTALDLSLAPADMPSRPTAQMTAAGDLDLIVPIGLAGYPEARIGMLRIGLSGAHAASQIHGQTLLIRGLAFGSLVPAMALLTLGWVGLRRRGRSAASRETGRGAVRCGELVIDTDARLVSLFGRPIDLTPKMYELVVFLAKRPGVTFTDDELLAALWADSPYAASGDVKQCIYMVRQRFGAVHADPKEFMVNVKGFGYRLIPPSADGALRGD
ncbi:winged helix-turn-helix domain-containing protein, partial [Candidatus Bipolaricaulota bacterium]|nr:winged helix-turn-helix domain-containing protein [Candidatus Bipolaricaulota bacterium]